MKLECKDLAEFYPCKFDNDGHLFGCCYDCHEYKRTLQEAVMDNGWTIIVCCQTLTNPKFKLSLK